MKSIEKYRLYDLATLTVIGIILEVLCIKVTSGFASFGLAITLIALIRWGLYGVGVGAIIGVSSVIGLQMLAPSWELLPYEIFVNVFGNLGVVLCYLILPNINRKKMKKTFEILLLYAIIGYIGQSFCRSFIVTLYVNDFTSLYDEIYGIPNVINMLRIGSMSSVGEILKYSFVVNLTGNFLMTWLVAFVVLLIVNQIEGILVDPVQHIIDQREEIKRSYEVFEGFNLPDIEPEEEKKDQEDKEVDEDE